MKYTLLDLVQNIASSMDSDEVNSIGDSVESMQIATVVRTAYFDLIQRANLPEHYSLVSLSASLDNLKPTLMYVPGTVSKIVWIKYNSMEVGETQPNMILMDPLPLEDFFNRMNGMNIDASDVTAYTHTVGTDVFDILCYNDRHPQYYTTFDDNTIIFDSYDSALDTTLQKSKTQCYGRTVIPFSMSDSFTPDLDDSQFPLLLNEAKSLAWMELKQAPHPIAERNLKRGWSNAQRSKYALQAKTDFENLPDFGRKNRSRTWSNGVNM